MSCQCNQNNKCCNKTCKTNNCSCGLCNVCKPKTCSKCCKCQIPPVIPSCDYPLLCNKGTCPKYICQTAPCGYYYKDTGVDDAYEVPIFELVACPTCFASGTPIPATCRALSGVCEVICKTPNYPNCPFPSLVEVVGSCDTYVCKTPPSGFTGAVVGYDKYNNPIYEFVPIVCLPATTCPVGQYAVADAPDSNGCTTYSCADCVIPNAPTNCPIGTEPSLTGNDANGCPSYVCSACPTPVPIVCQTGSFSSLTGVDNDGCPMYVCTTCPTPAPPTCPSGETPTASTDPTTGCPTYICSTCPVATPISCGSGRYPSLTGNDSSGCPAYVCLNCPTPTIPTCPTGEEATLTGTDSNGCPSYVCSACPPPNPITCLTGEYSTLTGTDNSGCPIYVCTTCPTPTPLTCPSGEEATLTGTDTNGCPAYECSSCPTPSPMSCSSGQYATLTATDSNGCPAYVCTACPTPSKPTCPNGQEPLLTGTDSTTGCPSYVCSTCPTPSPISCPSGQYQTLTTTDSNGCPAYACTACPTPNKPACTNGYATLTGTDPTTGCPTYICTSCPTPTPISCPTGEYQTLTATDSNGCPAYACSVCPTPTTPSCPSGETATLSTDPTTGCPAYICATGPVTCPTSGNCCNGFTSYPLGLTDSNGCAEYRCYPTIAQNGQPTCTTTATTVNCTDSTATSEPATNPNLAGKTVLSYADGTSNTDMCGDDFNNYTGSEPLVWSDMFNGGLCPTLCDGTSSNTVTCPDTSVVSGTCSCCPESALQILDLMNGLRAAYGLNPLQWNTTLATYAQRKTCDMSTNNAPVSSGGKGLPLANGCLFNTNTPTMNVGSCAGQFAAMQHQDLNGQETWDWMVTDGVSSQFANWGENIACVSSGFQSACFFMQQWTSDCGHLGNLLGDYTVVGIAICDNGTNAFSSQEFGTLA